MLDGRAATETFPSSATTTGADEAVEVSRTISDELDPEILYYVPNHMGVSIVYGVRRVTSFLNAIPRMQGVVSWRILPVKPTEDQQLSAA